MPHIIFEGSVDVGALGAAYTPETQQQGTTILKTGTAFVSQDGQQALIESLVAAGGPPQRFLTQVLRKDNRTVVRIYPGSTPELTVGVRSLLRFVASLVGARDGGMRVVAENLGRCQGPR